MFLFKDRWTNQGGLLSKKWDLQYYIASAKHTVCHYFVRQKLHLHWTSDGTQYGTDIAGV